MSKAIKYSIAEYDYKTKRNRTLSWYNNSFTALNALFIYVLEYLQVQDGSEKVGNSEDISKYMFYKKDFRSKLKASLNPGHYIIRDPESHVYKLEIWKKSLVKSSPGMFYGEYVQEHWGKVFDIDIVETQSPEKPREIFLQEISKMDIEEASRKWKNLNNSLIGLDCIKKIKESIDAVETNTTKDASTFTNDFIKSLKTEYPNLFGFYARKPKTSEKLLSESTIFEVNLDGNINSYKTSAKSDCASLILQSLQSTDTQKNIRTAAVLSEMQRKHKTLGMEAIHKVNELKKPKNIF